MTVLFRLFFGFFFFFGGGGLGGGWRAGGISDRLNTISLWDWLGLRGG